MASKSIPLVILLVSGLSLATLPPCRAQMAVIDVASIAKLVQQVGILSQQLAEARAQLLQAQTQYQSITGSRGMQRLMTTADPNYLPTSSSELALASLGQGPYASLARAVVNAMEANAVLTPGQLLSLPTDEQALVQSERQSAALQEALSQQAIGNASERFADVQRLNSAIAATSDEKGVLELQATISAEQGMLLEEQTKLQILDRAVQAQKLSTDERAREMVIAGTGRFATRFEPELQ